MISTLKGSPLATNEFGSTRATRFSTRPINQQSHKCTITLERVIGNTISGPNGFDSLRNGSFAICSGSTAVVSKILPDETLRQQVYRAPIRSISETSLGVESLQNSPSRTRGRQVPRSSILPSGIIPSDTKDSPGKAAIYKKPKGTSCLALSPNALFLAVGETGYCPRILLYSLNSGVDTPVSITAEHVSGVQTLCFSPDSRWLCSVGDIYDGSIYIWSVSPKGHLKLQTSSRCTSTIQDTKWINDKSIITAGIRHLKIWRPDLPSQPHSPTKPILPAATRVRQESPALSNPTPTSLPGRNVLLGNLLESTFVVICSIGESRALVGSEFGDICIVNVQKGTQKLELITNLEAPLRCISFNLKTEIIFAATSDSKLWTCNSSDILMSGSKLEIVSRFKDSTMPSSPLAMGIIEDRLLWVDDRRCLSVYRLTCSLRGHYLKCNQDYPAHSAAVNGSIIFKNGLKTSLLSYDSCGYLISWNSTLSPSGDPDVQIGIRSSGPEYESNELKIVIQDREDRMRICGDKYGNLSLLNSGWLVCDQLQAHTSDINDLALIESCEHQSMVISCGRDRIIQAFEISNMKFELMQTLDQHNGSVNKLEVIEQDGTLLLSLSSDRTILVHKLVQLEMSHALICVRIITLKASPLSCALDMTNPTLLVVTTTDKQLQVFQLKTGVLENSVRLTDDEDQIALQNIALRSIIVEDRPFKLLIGISNTDKTLRIHNAQSGEVLCKANGHSESITSLTVLDEQLMADGSLVLQLITTSLDATIMLWKLCCQISTRDAEPRDTIKSRETREIPLRKVLSKSQLAGFVATLDSNEWSPLPSPTRERSSARNISPDRLRRKTSNTNLLKDSPALILSPGPRYLRENSPVVTPSPSRRRTVLPCSESPEKDITGVMVASNLLINNLRALRSNIRASPNDLHDIPRDELKLELEMTLDALASRDVVKDDCGKDTSYFSAFDRVQSMTIMEDE